MMKFENVLDLAINQGARSFIHYSFPRHMSYVFFAQSRDFLLKEECEKLGIEFVEVTTPDSAIGDSVQEFILEDVSSKVEKYGKNTAFYTTNSSLDRSIRLAVSKNKAIYPDYYCPSPAHGFPKNLGIEVPEDKKGDIDFI